jgi:hypothetical protein
MGARVVDDRLVLFSMPATGETGSQYSSWVRSERLARFGLTYIQRAWSTGKELTGLGDLAEAKTFRAAFEKLANGAGAQQTNYGYIDTFEKAETIRDRMLEWAHEGDWLPVIS